MSWFKKALSLVLSVMMVVLVIPQSVYALIGESFDGNTPVNEQLCNEYAEPFVVGEDEEKRTETSKTFRMSDGSYCLADYGFPVHFQNSDNKWTDYDNSLTFNEAVGSDDMDGYVNNLSDVSIKFAKNAKSSNLLKISSGSYKVSIGLVGADKSKSVEVYDKNGVKESTDINTVSNLSELSSGVVYEDILLNTDLEYIVTGNNVKENIIIKNKCDNYNYTFELKLKNITPELTSGGELLLKDSLSGEIVMYIPAGYMYDSNGGTSQNVTYSLSYKNGQKYELTVHADEEWLNSSERAFPVTIDPTVLKYHTLYSGGRIKDTYVVSSSETNHGSYAWLSIGTSGASEYISLIGLAASTDPDVPDLPKIPESAVIVNAQLRLRARTDTAKGVTVGAYQATDNWNSYDVTYSTMPGNESELLDYFTVSSGGSEFCLDITSAMQRWYNNPDEELYKKGIKLKALSGTGLVKLNAVNDTDYQHSYPSFIISYRDTKGLESIWPYASHGAGNAGEGNVNLFNGNLVLVRNDTATKGLLLPVTVSHVYNGYMAGKEFSGNDDDIVAASFTDMKIGKGWKLSAQETITAKKLKDNNTWYVYNDSDGTELYFLPYKNDSGLHNSEDGYPIYLKVNSSSSAYKYEITDDYNNTKYFNDKGYLVKMTDGFGNARLFTYNSDGQLTKISLTPKNGTDTAQILFTYNSLGALQKITNAADASDYTSFYYSDTYNGSYSASSAGYLRQAVSTKNGISRYYYNSDGTLSYTYDADTSYRIDYSYLTYQGVKRIASVAERGSSTVGQTIGLSYSDKKTVIRTCGQDDSFGNADDICTTYLMDNYGRTVCSYSSDINGNEVYGAASAEYTPTVQASKKNNKITVDSVKGTTAENLVLNGNCESSASWSGSVSGSGYARSVSSDAVLYGNNSIKLSSSSASTGHSGFYQTVTIPEAGIYTLSAYVKTDNVVSGNYGGAYISFAGNAGGYLTGTTDASVQGGWVRVSVTHTFSGSRTALVELKLENASGSAYFDCVQVEKGEVPSDYNLLQNGGMSLYSGWTASPLYYDAAEREAIEVVGNINAYNYEGQIVDLSIPKETTLMLSGWGKANSVPTGTDAAGHNRTFRIVANILYADGTRDDQAADFNPNITEWQYSAAAVVPKKDVTSITVFLSYDFNGNTAYFDDVALTVEPAQTYAYDEDGNMVSTVNEAGNKSLISYVNGTSDIADFTNIYGHKYEYEYLTVNNVSTHSVSKMKKMSSDGNTAMQTLSYQHDAYGNIVDTTLSANGQSTVVNSHSSYIEEGNFLSSVTDALGGITSKGYTDGKLLSYVQNAVNNRTGYLYDSRDRLTQIFNDKDKDCVIDSDEEKVQYVYSNNRLTGITTESTSYNFTYDSFGNVTQVKAGNSALVTFTYRSRNGKLLKRTFANGDVEEYTYDKLDRLISVKYNGTVSYKLIYNSNGSLAKCIDNRSGLTHEYVYDSLGRLIRAWQKNTSTGVKILAVENLYDSYGRANGSKYIVNGKTLNYSITYNANNGLASKVSVPDTSGTANLSYNYDQFERLKYSVLSTNNDLNLGHEYTYYTADGKTTSLIKHETLSTFFEFEDLVYTYDEAGNITQIRENGSLKNVYEYKATGQLVREYDCTTGTATVYGYDNAGNITYKHLFNGFGSEVPSWHIMACYPLYLSSEISYTYGNSDYGDILTDYNGTSISYNADFNPLNWRNASSLSWSGRNLTNATLTNGKSVSYGYNGFGTRVEKTVGNTVHRYMLDGNNIIAEVVTGDENYTVYYYYDAAGSVIGLRYNNADYYFHKNWRGDVVNIVDTYSNVVVTYNYDAWGRVASVTGNEASGVGRINPIRYRGYYYDEETGFYYLNSRYYDPEVCRFISPDSTDVLAASPSSLTDKNLFAYCDNNPVMYEDDGGEFWHILAGAVVGAVVGAVSSVVSQAISGEEINWKAVGISAASGAVSGAINAAVPCAGPIVTGLVEGTVSAVTYAATEKIAYGRDPDPAEVLKVGITSGITAGVGKKVAQNLGAVQCFISGTIVAAACCNKPIDDIQPGDLVWATDPETGETALKEVVRIFRGETCEWVHITVNGEEIVCTPGHPFYLPDKGWVNAGELRIGDVLIALDGSQIIVKRIYREQLKIPETTYNFEVEDFHTYYVSNAELLVHNKCDKLQTNNQSNAAAKKLGYEKVPNASSHGQAIYHNPRSPRDLRYITADIDSHSGGIWKTSRTVRGLSSKTTRTGTYNIDLTIRIGD